MYGIYNLFYEVAVSSENKTALVYGNERVTYAKLNKSINKVSWGLKNIGVGAGTQVGLLLPNCIEFIESFYALHKLGAFVIPINFRLSFSEIDQYLEATACKYLVYSEVFNEVVCQLKSKYPNISFVCVQSEDYLLYKSNEISSDWAYWEDLPADAHVLALMTGGTTGKSKGAVHSKLGLLMQVVTRRISIYDYYEDRPDVVALIPIPMFHIGGLSIMMDTFAHSGTIVLCTEFNCDRLMDIIEKEKVSSMLLVPPNLASEIAKNPLTKGRTFPSVRILGIGGSSIDLVHLGDAFKIFPNCRIRILYNSSEHCCVISQFLSAEDITRNPKIATSLGTLELYSSAKLINEEGNICKPGEVGELWGKNIGMLSKYVDSDAKLVDGYLATGDLMYMDEQGYYYFIDRKKDMIKSGGENVYSKVVEDILLKHPMVSDCAVIGISDPYFSELVTAVIVPKKGCKICDSEIQEFCKLHIASYKKPRKVILIDKLPKSALGKVRKYELRKSLSAQ